MQHLNAPRAWLMSALKVGTRVMIVSLYTNTQNTIYIYIFIFNLYVISQFISIRLNS